MNDNITLASYGRGIWRSSPFVLLACLLGAGLAWAYSAQQATLYSSQAVVLVTQAEGSSVVDIGAGQSGVSVVRALQNEASFAQSETVLAAVAETLGQPGGAVVEASAVADLLVFRATDQVAQTAAVVAQTHAEVFIRERIDRTVEEYTATALAVEGRIADVETALAAAGIDEAERSSLQRQREVLLFELQDLNLGADLRGGQAATIIQSAAVPPAPFQPSTRQNVVLGGLVGFLLGIGGVGVWLLLDQRIRSGDELMALDGRLVAFVAVPARTPDAPDAQVITLSQPDSPAAEAYRALRASVAFIAAKPDVRVIQVTSPAQGEGKSTTVANLAVAYARAGKRVIVVDGDLRRPALHGFFGTPAAPGLADVLAGFVAPDAVAHRPVYDATLALIAAGSVAPNPGELLSADDAESFFDALADSADLVLVDSPPVLAVSDALPIAQLADATIIVVQANKTKRKELEATLEALDRVDANVVGAVLNRAKAGDGVYSQAYLSERPTAPTDAVAHNSLTSNGAVRDQGEVIELREPPQRVQPVID